MDSLHKLLEHLKTLEVRFTEDCRRGKADQLDSWVQGHREGVLDATQGFKSWVEKEIEERGKSGNGRA